MIDIQKIAEQAGFNVKNFKPPVITAQHSNGSWVSVGDELDRFAALHREAMIAELVAESGEPELFFTENFGLGDASNVWGYSREQLAGAVLRERERIASYVQSQDDMVPPEVIAAAIRSGE